MNPTLWVYEGGSASLVVCQQIPQVHAQMRHGAVCCHIFHGAFDLKQVAQVVVRWPQGREPVVKLFYDGADHAIEIEPDTTQAPLTAAS